MKNIYINYSNCKLINRYILKIFIGLIFIVISSCADKDVPAQITISDNSLEYFQDRMDFSAEGGSKTIEFTTNKNWKIHISESGMNVDWLTVSQSSGQAGNISVTVSALQNTSYSDRNVMVELSVGEISKKMRISQKQNNAILLSSTIYELPMDGGIINLQVKSNVNYNIEIPDQYKNWIHKGTKSRGLESEDLEFIVDKNIDYNKREGEIIISDGTIHEIVKVYQSGGGILVLSQNEYNVSSDKNIITIDLSSNFEYDYQIQDVDWIKLNNGTRGMSSHTLYFEISPNETYNNRKASICFFDPNGTVCDTVSINQAQKDAIIISKKKYDLNAELNFISVDINTNIEFKVIVPETSSSWVQLVNNQLSRVLNPYKLDFRICENTTYDKRSGIIIIEGVNSAISDTVLIEQSQNDAIFIISPKNVNVPYTGDKINVDIKSNVDIELEHLQDWTHSNNTRTRGLEVKYLSLDVDPNETPYKRTGTVLVKKINEDVPIDTMYIHQEGGFLTLTVAPGQLKKLLLDYSDLTIEKMKLYGSLNIQDYLALREIKTLWNIDLYELSDQTMPKQAFMNVSNIKTVKLPKNLIEIPDQLFNMTSGGVMQGLTCELIIPSTVKRIGKYAFSCNALSGKLIIPESVEIIDEYAFWSLWGISELAIGDGVKRLENSCFAGASGKISYIGKNIEFMGDNVFNSCAHTGTIIIPDKVTSIGSTFFNGSKYSSIVLGSSLTSIGWYSLNSIPAYGS